jgi:hypothetical protein
MSKFERNWFWTLMIIAWDVVGLVLGIAILVAAFRTYAQPVYTEITAGTFDPYPTTVPFVLPAPPVPCPYCTEPAPMQPYDDVLIETAPGQIQSEDGYRIWITDDSSPTAQ